MKDGPLANSCSLALNVQYCDDVFSSIILVEAPFYKTRLVRLDCSFESIVFHNTEDIFEGSVHL